MKLKQTPEDFQVEEITARVGGADGDHAFYRLEKAGWSTHDALEAIRERWNIDRRRISVAGLKDRHAHTVQYISIFRGPRRGLQQHTITLTYLGQLLDPYTSDDILHNHFRITLRELTLDHGEIEERLGALTVLGMPNYFDDQRFGSVDGPDGEFIGRLIVKGRFEDALKLALTGTYSHDGPEARTEKELLMMHWGDWRKAHDALHRGHAREIVGHLAMRPGDFKGALVRLHPELRGLHLSAYQSHLWNRILARWVERHSTVTRPIRSRLGPLPMPVRMPGNEFAQLSLPLPTWRWKPDPGDTRLPLVEEILAEDGLTLRDMQVRGVRELFFSRGERLACLRPVGLRHEWDDDSLRLEFELPRGAYATLIVKAMMG